MLQHLLQTGEGKCDLGLGATHPHRPYSGCCVAQSMKQGRLPNTWLADHRGGSAPTLDDACQQVLEEGQLPVTTTERPRCWQRGRGVTGLGLHHVSVWTPLGLSVARIVLLAEVGSAGRFRLGLPPISLLACLHHSTCSVELRSIRPSLERRLSAT